jgi:hypothetical protein
MEVVVEEVVVAVAVAEVHLEVTGLLMEGGAFLLIVPVVAVIVGELAVEVVAVVVVEEVAGVVVVGRLAEDDAFLLREDRINCNVMK